MIRRQRKKLTIHSISTVALVDRMCRHLTRSGTCCSFVILQAKTKAIFGWCLIDKWLIPFKNCNSASFNTALKMRQIQHSASNKSPRVYHYLYSARQTSKGTSRTVDYNLYILTSDMHATCCFFSFHTVLTKAEVSGGMYAAIYCNDIKFGRCTYYLKSKNIVPVIRFFKAKETCQTISSKWHELCSNLSHFIHVYIPKTIRSPLGYWKLGLNY